MSRMLLLYLASLMVRSVGIAAIVWLLTFRLRSVALRHAIWVVALVSIMLMPVADAVLPAKRNIPTIVTHVSVPNVLAAPATVLSAAAGQSPAVEPPPRATLDWWLIAVSLYGLIGGFLLLRLGLSYRKLRKLRRTSRAIYAEVFTQLVSALRIRRPIRLYESENVRVPLTIGFLRPAVMLPSDWRNWAPPKLRAVCSHELTHVLRGDWAVSVLAAIHRSLFWLNPLSRFLDRHISELAEQACDEAAVQLTGDISGYAEVLLQFASAHQGYRVYSGGLAMAKKEVRSRIERILRMEQPSRGMLKRTIWVLILSAAMPVIYLASTVQNASSVSRTPAYGELLATLRHSAGTSTPSPVGQKLAQVSQENQKLQQTVAIAQRSLTSTQEKEDSLNPNQGEVPQDAEIQNAKQLKMEAQLEQLKAQEDALLHSVTRPQPDAERLKLEAQIEQLRAQEDALLRSYTRQYPTVRALEAQMQELQKQIESKDVLLDLPDNEGDLLAYLRALAQTRQIAPSLADLLNRTRESSTVPFNFALNGSAEGTYSIKASSFNGSQECGKSASCQFLIFSNGIVASNNAKPSGYPGMIVNQVLRSGTLEFTLTCNSQECTVVSVEDGKTTSQTLKSNETAVFPESAQINVTVN